VTAYERPGIEDRRNIDPHLIGITSICSPTWHRDDAEADPPE
jgi:hypothetical protein